MKKINLNMKTVAGILSVAALMSAPMGFTSCTEEIDESNFAIKSELTAADFIDADTTQFSMIKKIFQHVRLGNSKDASPIFSVLTARGNYTVFLPTNEAVQRFMVKEHLATIEDLLNDSINANMVAKSCIIDNQDGNAYETADMQTDANKPKAFSLPNLNDRQLTYLYDLNTTYYKINGNSTIIDEDNEVSNGFVHVVDEVIAPSALTLDKLIAMADNMKVFSYLLDKTTWADSIVEHMDFSYEDPDRPEIFYLPQVAPFNNQKDRKIGFTAFIETDSVYAENLGVVPVLDENGVLTNGEEFVNALKSRAEAAYGIGSDDLKASDNAINRFVAYHLLKGRMAFNKINHHYNEYNYKYGPDSYNPQTVNMPTNVWDYFSTMGKYPRLLKVTQVGDAGVVEDKDHKTFINRISEYANDPDADYIETGVKYKGILVSAMNGANDNDALNGFYYPIHDLLFYTKDYAETLSQTRVRFDVSTILHELLSNNNRGGKYTRFDNGFFENITNESPDTKLLYLMHNPSLGTWNDYQGDEFMVSGLYDFTFKLPPVPADGIYEIRMGVAHNQLRGMCQIYFEDKPFPSKPAGLPYDMRQDPNPNNPALPWIKDGDDWTVNRENDRNFRNQGYMKGPQYFTICTGEGKEPVRGRETENAKCIRRIVGVFDMKVDKTYYLRFKTALKKTDSQFFMDYFEYASTAVYNGPVAEDIW